MSFAHQSVPTIPGPAGPQGDPGPQGDQGIQGAQGPPGDPAPDNFLDLVDTPASYTGQSGQVVAVKATEDALEFIAPAAGVSDHGLLTGLLDDDHPQYAALAQAETIAALWTLPGLKLTDAIQDSGGTVRITIATTAPFITLSDDALNDNSGDAAIRGRLAVGYNPTLQAYSSLYINDAGAAFTRRAALNINEGLVWSPTTGQVVGVGGFAGSGQYGINMALVAGLNFGGYYGEQDAYTLSELSGIRVFLYPRGGSVTTLTAAYGIRVLRPSSLANTNRPGTVTGLEIQDQHSAAGLTTENPVIGIRVFDSTGGTAQYLLEIGPATPYLRLVGGAAPAANQTNLWLAEGVTPTLRQVQWKLYSALVAADKVAVLV